jgi:serine/threonine-protein kinase RsbW
LQEASQSVKSQASNLEFVFTADSAAMFAARDRIMDFLHEQGLAQQEEIDILVALQEALANAVLHGCQNDPSKVVRCSVDVDPEAITIVIRDPGTGFDTAAVTDLSDDGTNLTEHGRGIHLMRGLMDEVSYWHGGSEVRLKKLRTNTD